MDVFVFDFKYVCVRYLEGRYVRVACFGIGWKRKSEGEVTDSHIGGGARETDRLIDLSVGSVCL